VINDKEISRRHARLTTQGGEIVLEDMGSTNGTYVDGKRISAPHVLKPGEVISFGEQISLLFEAMTFDPTATVASPRGAVSVPPRPVAAPPPPPAYSGQVPPGPASPHAQKSSSRVWILVGVAVVLCLCATSVFLYYAPQSFWCLFPIWPAGACP
jgi:hypothetical protein